MLFNSYFFLLIFLPVTLGVYWFFAVRQRVTRIAWLTLVSYVFYGMWNVAFLPLMLASTTVDYVAGGRIFAADLEHERRRWLWVSLGANLLALGIFKYANFGLDSAETLLNTFGLQAALPSLNVILPVGISFYTFQSMSYSIDIYRRKATPARDFLTFACFVSLFPQLVAGPIVRYVELAEQLERDPRERDRADDMLMGFTFFVIGLVKKVIIADSFAGYVDPLMAGDRYLTFGAAAAWLTMLGYTFQLYFDFSGYSDMAVGLGKLIGFDLPQNFNAPYRAQNMSDFWRRWHITLSSWLRDYLYIPLGGSRFGRTQTLRNLVITMFLGGLWHGAGWTFVLWGLFHGLMLVVDQLIRQRRWPASVAWLGRPITFIAVVFGWVLFRSVSVAQAGSIWLSMLGVNGLGQSFVSQRFGQELALLVVLGLLAVNLLPTSWQIRPHLSRRVAVGLGGALAVCLMMMTRTSPFLYFQF